MPARFLAGSITWAMLLGEQAILSSERLELRSGITLAYGQGSWVTLPAANIVPHRVSTTREKSLEPRISLRRSFHLSRPRRAAFSVFRCCLATTADRRSASISTAMWLDILRARMAVKLSCGREARACTISAFCPAAITAELATSTTWMRLPAHLRAQTATVPSCGRKPVMCAILGRCREIRQARLPQSTTMGMSLGTRKVHGGCGRFCGLKQLECRISGCSQVETPAKLLVSTTRVLWSGVRQARREIAPLYGQNKQANEIETAQL